MLFVGDFVPQATVPRLPDFGGQWMVANLEGPVCADGLPGAPKVGVRLRNEPFAIPGKVAFALANNHMMDFGADGLRQTRQFLSDRGHPCAGAGEREDEARRPMFLEECGKRIAVISCCERQFGVATGSSDGVAAKGEWLYAAIAAAKATADFVVVSCHCASEFSTAVSPRLQVFYRSLVDAGADVVHGHHAHVPQGWEAYRGRPIFYGLGNFAVARENWKGLANGLWSLLAWVDFSGETPSWKVEPFGEVPSDVQNYLIGANLGFESPELLEALWQDSCVRLYHRLYEQQLRAPSVADVPLALRDRCRKLRFLFSDLRRVLLGRERPDAHSLQRGRVIYHYFACESHADVIQTALGVLTGSIPDERGRLPK